MKMLKSNFLGTLFRKGLLTTIFLLFSLLTSDFTAVTVVISFGVLIGKASRVQLLFVAIFECIFFAINEVIINEFLHTTDAGGSIVVHIFAAYFGLAVSVVLQNSGDEHENEASTYQSDIFAMIGKKLLVLVTLTNFTTFRLSLY